MRASGPMQPAQPVGTSDHACWGYASDAERAEVASAWLGDGLRAGQRALYVAEGSHDELVAQLATVPGRADAIAAGALVVRSSAELYDLATPIDAPSQLAAYAGAVEQARADGYDGLRVAADITPLVLDPDRREAHLHWEQVADRYMTEHPLAPVCMYDRRRVADLEPIVCVHPLHGPDNLAFQLYGVGPQRAALEGEVDSCVADVLQAVLGGLPESDTELDLAHLSFMDARSTWILQRELDSRRRTGRPLTVTAAPDPLRHLWHLLRFDLSLLAA